MFRTDSGDEMTVKQVCDIAWEQFGAAAILTEIAGRLAWNSGWLAVDDANAVSKDAEALAMIAERLARLEAADRSVA